MLNPKVYFFLTHKGKISPNFVHHLVMLFPHITSSSPFSKWHQYQDSRHRGNFGMPCPRKMSLSTELTCHCLRYRGQIGSDWAPQDGAKIRDNSTLCAQQPPIWVMLNMLWIFHPKKAVTGLSAVSCVRISSGAFPLWRSTCQS